MGLFFETFIMRVHNTTILFFAVVLTNCCLAGLIKGGGHNLIVLEDIPELEHVSVIEEELGSSFESKQYEESEVQFYLNLAKRFIDDLPKNLKVRFENASENVQQLVNDLEDWKNGRKGIMSTSDIVDMDVQKRFV